jgi:hypothetical protein
MFWDRELVPAMVGCHLPSPATLRLTRRIGAPAIVF